MSEDTILKLAEERLRKESDAVLSRYIARLRLREGETVSQEEVVRLEKHCGVAVQVDMNVFRTKLSEDYAKLGLTVLPLREAVRSVENIRKVCWSLVRPDENLYTALVARYGTYTGYAIYVPPDVKIETPLYTCMLVQSSSTVQLVHNVVYLSRGAELRLLTGCLTTPKTRDSAHISVTEIYLEEGARLYLTMIHSWNETSEIRSVTKIIAEPRSQLISYYVCHSPVSELDMSTSVILQDSAKADLITTVIGRGKGHYNYSTEAVLAGTTAGSTLTSRIVTRDYSRVRTVSRIVGKGSQARGHVECLGLVLSPGSTIVSVPELEAQRDDVELSHEAAIGRISEDELTYLMTKGLSEDEAKNLIVRGFLKVEHPLLPPALKSIVDRVMSELLRRAL